MNKWNKIRIFRAIVGVLIVLSVGAFYISHLQKNAEQAASTVPNLSPKVRTIERAKNIAAELKQKNFMLVRFVENTNKRGLASEEKESIAVETRVEAGEYGRDAWGQPLHFKKFEDKVVVWSFGDNRVLESSEQDLNAVQAKGDDIVVSLSL